MRKRILEAFKKANLEGIVEDLVKQAAVIEGARGGDKREFVIRQLAKILDERFKFGVIMEAIDGGLFYVIAKLLSPLVQVAYDKVVLELGTDPVAEYRKLTEDKVKLENRIKVLEGQLNKSHDESAVVPSNSVSDDVGVDNGSMKNLRVRKSNEKV